MSCTLRMLVSAALLGFVSSALPPSVQAAEEPMAEKYLRNGTLPQGIVELQQHLEKNPKDNEARFGLGILQFLRAVEHMVQSFHQYGLKPTSNLLPFLRLPVPANAEAKLLSYAALREVYATLLKDLDIAEQTLSLVKGDAKLPLHVGQIRLDLNGDGRADPDETFWKLYSQMNRQANVSQKVAEDYLIAFDGADVFWLRGYCHLLMALDEFILAYNWKDAFDSTAHRFFPNAETPFPYLKTEVNSQGGFLGSPSEIADVVAFIHLIRFPVDNGGRMKSALSHLESMINLSQQTWDAIAKETDDDHEWIPGPEQAGVIPGVKVTAEMVQGWRDFLAEAESILQGKKLLPYWRVADGRGVNLRKVFLEPTQFDLVLWIQGTSAAPYLEKGELSKPASWARLQQIFQGNFIGFAIWFN